MNITIEMQIACARRELALRQRVYPRWVEAKKMAIIYLNQQAQYVE